MEVLNTEVLWILNYKSIATVKNLTKWLFNPLIHMFCSSKVNLFAYICVLSIRVIHGSIDIVVEAVLSGINNNNKNSNLKKCFVYYQAYSKFEYFRMLIVLFSAQRERCSFHGQQWTRHKRITVFHHIRQTATSWYEIHSVWKVGISASIFIFAFTFCIYYLNSIVRPNLN